MRLRASGGGFRALPMCATAYEGAHRCARSEEPMHLISTLPLEENSSFHTVYFNFHIFII